MLAVEVKPKGFYDDLNVNGEPRTTSDLGSTLSCRRPRNVISGVSFSCLFINSHMLTPEVIERRNARKNSNQRSTVYSSSVTSPSLVF